MDIRADRSGEGVLDDATGADEARMIEGARDLLSALLRKSSHLIPDDLPKLLADEAQAVGFLDAVIFLADLEERVLMPLNRTDLDPQEIDGTLAGRAFKVEHPFVARNADGDTFWLPLIDGAERLGALYLRSPVGSQAVVDASCDVARLVAELIVTKSAYGDALVLARRLEPMTLAAELRWAMLPPVTFRDRRLTIACVLEPPYQVAGDAFDYAINQGVLHLAVFDAMGHGLEASRMATVAVAAYRFSRRHRFDLESTYHMLDRTILEQFGNDRFVTAQLATLDAYTGTFRWLAAGHPQPLLLRQGRVAHALSSDPALPLGLGDAQPMVAEVSLEPGDRLFLFTDGVVEARSPGGERFGQDRLVDLTRRALSDQQTLAATVRRLALSVRDHREGPLDDDATILFVGWHPEGTL